MKRVSFETAKALKAMGYPQHCNVHIPYYDSKGQYHYGSQIGAPRDAFIEENTIYAPTYIDAWLWLWTEKNLHIPILNYDDSDTALTFINNELKGFDNPEDALTKAIESCVKDWE